MSTWMTYWYFLLLSRNMFSTSDECSRGCSRMGFLSKRRNARSMHSQSCFWGTSSRPRECAWIPTRLTLWWIGQPQILALQRFLGFANLYRCFIRKFSQLAAPLTTLTSTRTKFCWSAAEAEFANLKSRFVSAPIVIALDPTRQFVVEVDASEMGVGAVLFQRSSSDDKMHPCAFFSHRLPSAERNYAESCWQSS